MKLSNKQIEASIERNPFQKKIAAILQGTPFGCHEAKVRPDLVKQKKRWLPGLKGGPVVTFYHPDIYHPGEYIPSGKLT